MRKYYIQNKPGKEVEAAKNSLEEQMKRLEQALEMCRFGRFHYRLLLAALTGYMASSAVTTTSSFILTSAECDLALNNVQKGMIIAAPFIGQVLLSCISGIIADALGRKPCLIFGYCLMCLCCILEGSSQTFVMLLSAKLIAGMALCFCFNGVGTMLAELTDKGLRDRVMLIGTTFGPLTQILVVVLAWAVLPHSWSFVLWEGYFVLNSWNIYLYGCAIFGLLSAVQFYYLPESPKYHLAHGKHDEALYNLKKIYNENTGLPMESFPVTSFSDSLETASTEKRSFKQQFSGVASGIKELFSRPLISTQLLISTLCFIFVLNMSTLRLWYPQLSTMIEEYKKDHNDTTYFCTMIDSHFQKGHINHSLTVDFAVQENVCVLIITGKETYFNSIFIYFMPLIALLLSVVMVDYVGQNLLIMISIVLSSILLLSLFWTRTPLQIASVIALANAFNNTQNNLLTSIALRIFPTTSRSLAMALGMMSGRIGSLVGNILLPVMLDFGCAAPFGGMLALIAISAILVCFLPNPSKENKETGDR